MEAALGPGLKRLLEALRAAGGRPYIVGGAVRDLLLGRPLHDVDVEVFGIEIPAFESVLAAHGNVDRVGRSFKVYKVVGLEGTGAVDIALPRRDSKVAPGHRGIVAEGDPSLSITEAARRRDFTMNALLLDPWTGAIEDPFGGRDDIARRLLRAVDPLTFGEDPLRALRAVQFAARFGFDVEPKTAVLCGSMPIAELPPDRIFGEIEKLLLGADHPSKGFELLKGWGLLGTVAPELVPLETTPQDPLWHPEGDVLTHTFLAIDQAASLREGLDRPRALAVMLGTLCHDLGKATTTKFEEGRIRSRGHEEAGKAPTDSLLDRWNVHSLLGYDLRGQVLGLVLNHLKPGQLYDDRERVSDGAIRRLAKKCEPALLYRVARADCLGRTGDFAPVAMEWFLERVRALDVEQRPPEPLLRGRDLLALGLSPGPEVGALVRAVYELQLDGRVETHAQALEAARTMLQSQPGAKPPPVGRP